METQFLRCFRSVSFFFFFFLRRVFLPLCLTDKTRTVQGQPKQQQQQHLLENGMEVSMHVMATNGGAADETVNSSAVFWLLLHRYKLHCVKYGTGSSCFCICYLRIDMEGHCGFLFVDINRIVGFFPWKRLPRASPIDIVYFLRPKYNTIFFSFCSLMKKKKDK